MVLLWGDISICLPLHWFQLPCHSQAELSSLNGLKALGEGQKPHHDITFLLVQSEEEMIGDRNYGLLTVWVNPCQARVPSMEKVVGKLTTWASSGPDWPYALVQLHMRVPAMCTTPQGGALGHPTPERGRGNSLWMQISQLEVCQLLVASCQVVYPIGLNGCNEPIITSPPEPLASSVSLTAGEPVHLEIDIPPPPVGGARPKGTASW